MKFDSEISQEFSIDYLRENNLIETNQISYNSQTDYNVESIRNGFGCFVFGEEDLMKQEFVIDPLFPNYSIIEDDIIPQQILSTNEKKIFRVIYPEKSFINNNQKESMDFLESNDVSLIKRFDKKRKRFENADNILKKSMTAFLNKYLINNLNNNLRKIGNRTYFEKVPQSFIRELVNKANKKNNINLTLKKLFEKYNLYKRELKSIEEGKNSEIQKLFNMSFLNLYEIYIKSDEFNIKELNRLKRKNMNDWYLKTYKNITKDFIKF